MKKTICSLTFLVFCVCSFAQPPNGPRENGPALGNLQGLKIAYITKELKLSSDEAQKFWPVYYNFSDELMNAKKDKKDDVIAFDEKALNIKKKYFAEFKRIVGTDERANKVFLCEREFGNFIKREVAERQKQRGARPNNP